MTRAIPGHVDPDRTGASAGLVRVTGVSKHFGPVRAVDGVNLAIGRGELFGLIGHNGAGKSTLFKLLLGLLPATSGELLIDGESVAGRGFRAVRRKIGYLPENVVLYDNLSGLETLRFFARLKGAPDSDCVRALAQVGLADAAGRRVREYSKGMRQRIGFAQALLGSPRILFLDEPTAGLDPAGTHEFYAILRELLEQGVTVLLSSHILSEIEHRVDRLAIMAAGRIRALGTVAELREQVQMPLTFEIRASTEQVDALLRVLSGLRQDDVEVNAQGIRLRCPRAAKMAVLHALSALPEAVLDLQLHEPSLEDVFLGISESAAPCN